MALCNLFTGFALLTLVECAYEHTKKTSYLIGGEHENATEAKSLSLLQASSHLLKVKGADLPQLAPMPPPGASVEECPRREMIRCGDEVDASGKFEEPWKQPGCWITHSCRNEDKCMKAVDLGKQYTCSCPYRDERGIQVYRKPACFLRLGPLVGPTPPRLTTRRQTRRRRGTKSLSGSRRRRRRRRRRTTKPLPPQRSPIAPPEPLIPLPPQRSPITPVQPVIGGPSQQAPIAPPPLPPPTEATETCPLENMIRCEEVDVSGRFEAPWTRAGCELATPCSDLDMDACMAAGNTDQTYSCACPYKENGKQVHRKPFCSLMIR